MFQFRAFADHMTNPGEVEPTILMMNNGDGFLVKIMTTVDRALPWTSLPDSIRELWKRPRLTVKMTKASKYHNHDYNDCEYYEKRMRTQKEICRSDWQLMWLPRMALNLLIVPINYHDYPPGHKHMNDHHHHHHHHHQHHDYENVNNAVLSWTLMWLCWTSPTYPWKR